MPNRPLPPGTDHVFMTGERMLGRLSDDGRIVVEGEATRALPYLGYAASRPSARLINALAALLAQDPSGANGACGVEAG